MSAEDLHFGGLGDGLLFITAPLYDGESGSGS